MPSNTVRELKERIARELGLAPARQKLTTNWPVYGVEMEEEKTLFEYGIRVSMLNEDCYLAARMKELKDVKESTNKHTALLSNGEIAEKKNNFGI